MNQEHGCYAQFAGLLGDAGAVAPPPVRDHWNLPERAVVRVLAQGESSGPARMTPQVADQSCRRLGSG